MSMSLDDEWDDDDAGDGLNCLRAVGLVLLIVALLLAIIAAM